MSEYKRPTKQTRQPVHGICDADSIFYNAPYTMQNIEEDLTGSIVTPEIKECTIEYVHRIMRNAGVDTIELHFTRSVKNFEIYNNLTGEDLPLHSMQFREKLSLNALSNGTIQSGYKSNRKDDIKPIGYDLILEVLLNEFKCYFHKEWEADDAVVLSKKLKPSAVLIACDKDVLQQSIGRHYVYDKRKKFVEVSAETAGYYQYYQAIVGDPVDGYGGVKGIGAKGAAKYISPAFNQEGLWHGVLSAHFSKQYPERTAIYHMQMACMHQLVINNKRQVEVSLWTPPFMVDPNEL